MWCVQRRVCTFLIAGPCLGISCWKWACNETESTAVQTHTHTHQRYRFLCACVCFQCVLVRVRSDEWLIKVTFFPISLFLLLSLSCRLAHCASSVFFPFLTFVCVSASCFLAQSFGIALYPK